MNTLRLYAILALLTTVAIAQESYPVHPDSMPQEGVPQGKVLGPFPWNTSTLFPGTTRNYWIYEPAQYDSSRPACSLIIQDGLGRATGWKLPTVMDNLIHRKAMPVTIGIFIDHGKVVPASENAQPRFNRSFEYDGMGDRYARFLLEEILPEVQKTHNLSQDPNDRAIGGASSGAICAFTAAWERPDAFRRVLSTIGTYVGLRGGNEYPTLIRKTETKPIRVFLQDGSNDLNIYGGDWWTANQDMLSALTFSGYDVHHVWGEGGHNGNHSTAIMPDALRWLWRDYPEPIVPGTPPKRRTELLIPGEDWTLVSEGHRYTEGPAVNAAGEVFFSDGRQSKIHRVALDGTVSVFVDQSDGANGLMFGADGLLYACQMRAQRIVRYDADGQVEVLVEDAPCNDLVILANGSGYYTNPRAGQVHHFTPEGKTQMVADQLGFPNGVITTADQAFLLVADSNSSWIHSYLIQPDGKLAYGQRYGYVHGLDADSAAGSDGMTVDDQGRLYVATKLGVQAFDQLGRCHFIFTHPHPEKSKLSNLVFGGADRDILYVTCTNKVYKRKVNARGVVPSMPPVKPPKPGL